MATSENTLSRRRALASALAGGALANTAAVVLIAIIFPLLDCPMRRKENGSSRLV